MTAPRSALHAYLFDRDLERERAWSVADTLADLRTASDLALQARLQALDARRYVYRAAGALRCTLVVPALLLLVILSACGGPECTQGDHLELTGATPPPFTAEVVAVAQRHCDRPIAGRIEWRNDVEILPDRIRFGLCKWEEERTCGMDAWVGSPFLSSFPAWNTYLAHEIGHWCLQSHDEVAVQAWADRINAEAEAEYGDPPPDHPVRWPGTEVLP